MSDQPMLGIPDDQTWNGYAWVPTTETDPLAGQPLSSRLTHLFAGYQVGFAPHRHRLTDWEAAELTRMVIDLLDEVEGERSAAAMVAAANEPDGAEEYWQYRVELAERRGEDRQERDR